MTSVIFLNFIYFSTDNLLNEILADISKLQEEALAKDNAQAPALLGWIIKGLAMRGYRRLEEWIDKVRALFKIYNTST